MTFVRYRLSILLAVLFLAAVPNWASAATRVVTQAPCASLCADISPGDTLTVARKIAFKAPSKGTAVVTFHGVLNCGSNSMTWTRAVFQTQIVEKGTPTQLGPSGLYLHGTMEAADGGTRTVTFNLASTRVFTISKAGKHVYRFKIKTEILDTDVGCGVRNGVFTVQFSS